MGMLGAALRHLDDRGQAAPALAPVPAEPASIAEPPSIEPPAAPPAEPAGSEQAADQPTLEAHSDADELDADATGSSALAEINDGERVHQSLESEEESVATTDAPAASRQDEPGAAIWTGNGEFVPARIHEAASRSSALAEINEGERAHQSLDSEEESVATTDVQAASRQDEPGAAVWTGNGEFVSARVREDASNSSSLAEIDEEEFVFQAPIRVEEAVALSQRNDGSDCVAQTSVDEPICCAAMREDELVAAPRIGNDESGPPARTEGQIGEEEPVAPSSGQIEPLSGLESSPAVVSTFDRALEIADAAIQAADDAVAADIWLPLESPVPALAEIAPPQAQVAAPAAKLESPIESSEPLARSPLFQPAESSRPLSIDRAYGRLWDSLTATMPELPPWSIIVAGAEVKANAAWLLPAAVEFARRNSCRALLVDAIPARAGRKAGIRGVQSVPRPLAELLGVRPRNSLGDVLGGRVAWRQAVEATPAPGIELLAGGIAEGDLKADFNSRDFNLRLGVLLAELKSSYPLILIRAADPADPTLRPLFAAADGTLLQVELGQTARAAAEDTSSLLYLAGARVLGCVVLG